MPNGRSSRLRSLPQQQAGVPANGPYAPSSTAFSTSCVAAAHGGMLPCDFPPWQTVYHSFRRWRLDNTWEDLNTVLRERERIRQGRNARPSACIIDRQSVKATSVGGVRG